MVLKNKVNLLYYRKIFCLMILCRYVHCGQLHLHKKNIPLSNAVVENHFRQVKSTLSPGVRLTYSEFIGQCFVNAQLLVTRLVRL